jgi:hypothetical protein
MREGPIHAAATHPCAARACTLPQLPPVGPWCAGSPGPGLRLLSTVVGGWVHVPVHVFCLIVRCWACFASFRCVGGPWLGFVWASSCSVGAFPGCSCLCCSTIPPSLFVTSYTCRFYDSVPSLSRKMGSHRASDAPRRPSRRQCTDHV